MKKTVIILLVFFLINVLLLAPSTPPEASNPPSTLRQLNDSEPVDYAALLQTGKHAERLCFDCHPNPAASCEKCHESEWNKLKEPGSRHGWMNCLKCHEPHATKFWTYPDKEALDYKDPSSLCLQPACHGVRFAEIKEPNQIDPHNTKTKAQPTLPILNIILATIFNTIDILALISLTIEYRRGEL